MEMMWMNKFISRYIGVTAKAVNDVQTVLI